MHAHFGDVENNKNIENEPLQVRISDFKQDSQNMEVLSDFIDDVLEKAQAEALKKQESTAKKTNSKRKSSKNFIMPDFKNGKVVNRARGFVVRLFDAICNCANNATAPAQRMQGKRSSSSTTATTQPLQ